MDLHSEGDGPSATAELCFSEGGNLEVERFSLGLPKLAAKVLKRRSRNKEHEYVELDQEIATPDGWLAGDSSYPLLEFNSASDYR